MLVTGANRGIGKEICRQLSKLGYTVILCAQNLQKAEEAAKEIASQNGIIHPAQLDVSNIESIRNLASEIEKKFGKLDALINNAAIYSAKDTGSLNLGEEVFDETLKVNFYGPWRMARAFAPLLLKSDDARIVNLASDMGSFDKMAGGSFAYRLSKTALNNLTINLSHEFNSSVRVNSMCPGWVRTDMGGANALRDVSQGADTAVWLATDPSVPTGKFFRDREIFPW